MFIFGAWACLVIDIIGALSGQLKLGFGVFLFYFIGYLFADGDLLNALLYGAVIASTIDALVHLGFMASAFISEGEESSKS